MGIYWKNIQNKKKFSSQKDIILTFCKLVYGQYLIITGILVLVDIVKKKFLSINNNDNNILFRTDTERLCQINSLFYGIETTKKVRLKKKINFN